MRKFGLIGYPLSHSFSEAYFSGKFKNEKIDALFENFPLDNLNKFHALIEDERNLEGLSVTLPYKKDIIPFLDHIDGEAEEIGAVNAIRILRQDGRIVLKGYNTDKPGFVNSLLPYLPSKLPRALVLGTGGASLAVRTGLKDLGVEFLTVSRTAGKADLVYDDLAQKLPPGINLIVNTTPLGTYPDINNAPLIAYDQLNKDIVLFDLVYNPSESLFLKFARRAGCVAINGLQMLEIQAEKSWEIWNSPA